MQRRGRCDELDGRLLAALALYETALRRQPLPPLARELRARIGALITRLGAVRVDASAWPQGTHVRVGTHVSEAAGTEPGGTRQWVDPGLVEIIVEVPGFEPDKQTVAIAVGEEKVVTIAPPTPLARTSFQPPSASQTPTTLVLSQPSRISETEIEPLVHPLGYVSLAVGGAALVAGGVMGYLAIDRGRVVRSECPTPSTCSDAGANAANAGASFSTASTITLIGGAVVTLGALALIYLGGPRPKTIAVAGFVLLGGG